MGMEGTYMDHMVLVSVFEESCCDRCKKVGCVAYTSQNADGVWNSGDECWFYDSVHMKEQPGIKVHVQKDRLPGKFVILI